MRAFLLFLLFGLLSAAPVLATAVAGRIRIIEAADGASVRLALSKPLETTPRAFALAAPDRLAIDLSGASAERRDAAGAGAVQAARVSQFDPETVRIVVDLARPMRLERAVQGADHVLELRFVPVSATAFRSLVARGRNPVPGFAVAASDAPEPKTGAARLDAVEAALARCSHTRPHEAH
jgi:N-acetylmuramoyl-L-alanine amidase